MMYRLPLLLILLTVSLTLRAQVLPKEGSRLHYRLIGFSFPAAGNGPYKVEIAKGNYNADDVFAKNIVVTGNSGKNKVVLEVPLFGEEYTWRVTYSSKKKSQFYHFSTKTTARIDTANHRLRILQQAKAYEDSYVSLDAGGVLYDMKGRAVWYIPDSCGPAGGDVQGLKFTPQGTITFMNVGMYEINYNGNILWKAPNTGEVSGSKTIGEFYHHEFTRLSNGHYMLLGMQVIMCKSVSEKDTAYLVFSDNNTEQEGYMFGKFGTIIEYDEKGKVVWSWKLVDHLTGSDFDYYESRFDSLKRCDPHDNAFYFDEKNKCIYLGFRNLNRIMKIEYPSGKVLNVYGDSFKPGVRGTGANLLCNQHSIGISQDGYLYLFNNNSCQLVDSLPTIVELQEPEAPGGNFKKIWEYTCTMEGNYFRKFGKGGNVIELPDRSMFVCMGAEYSKIFIVNRAKEILWSALPERLMMPDNVWIPNHQYRANIISRKDLERLIWNAEKTAK